MHTTYMSLQPYTATHQMFIVLTCMYTRFPYIISSLNETKEELEEYQISSQELEAELETQLEQSEAKVKDLTATNQRLGTECDNLKVCV